MDNRQGRTGDEEGVVVNMTSAPDIKLYEGKFCKVCYEPLVKIRSDSTKKVSKFAERGVCSYICYTKTLPKPVCKGCGKERKKSWYGYCGRDCLKEYNYNLFLKKWPLRQDEKEVIYFKQFGLMYEPRTEAEVVFLFTKLHDKLGFEYIKMLRQKYPDCIAIDYNGREWKIEFEFSSSSFRHNPDGCDVVICWEHDSEMLQKKVIPLKNMMKTGIIRNVTRRRNKTILNGTIKQSKLRLCNLMWV